MSGQYEEEEKTEFCVFERRRSLIQYSAVRSRGDPTSIASSYFHRQTAQPHTPLPTSLMYRIEPLPQNAPDPPIPPTDECQANDGTYRRENGLTSRLCPECNRWIGLGPKGGEWSFQLHVNSTSCVKERKKNVSEAAHPVTKSTIYTKIPTPPPSLFTTPVSFTLDSPLPSLGVSSWSAPSSPQICSSPSYARSRIALPSLSLESEWYSRQPAAPPLAQKKCPGSLVLWEPGDPATTYPFNLHRNNQERSTKPPWTVAVGERYGSLRLWSDSCCGICGPSESCCQACTAITSSTKYHQIEDRATNDHGHRAYDNLTWEQNDNKDTGEKQSSHEGAIKGSIFWVIRHVLYLNSPRLNH